MTACVWLLIFAMAGVAFLAVELARNTSRIDAVSLPNDDDPIDADDPRFGDEIGRAW